jgi:hypothetical protein
MMQAHPSLTPFDLGVVGDQPMPDHTVTASTSAKYNIDVLML